jgi:structural maintenance of chromosome 3 (chondroitin sulfate proteoglycan 6)
MFMFTHIFCAQATSEGLRTIKRLVQEHSIPGVYGPLIDLFRCDEKLSTAVEVSAGNSLFDVVVDNSATAARLISLLNRERVGRVSFLPVQDLRAKELIDPRISDAFPMISHLTIHNSATRPAFQQVCFSSFKHSSAYDVYFVL